MPRRLILACMLAAGAARADPQAGSPAVTEQAQPDPSDQIIGASLGIAVGGRDTPGGLRLAGHYHYQLAERDWFDGRASFLFGGGGAECFRDRMDTVICDHGLTDGKAVEVSANVRRFFGSGEYMPFARAGIGVEIVRFGDDDITGIAFPLHMGVGLRWLLTPTVAVSAEAELAVGLARFNHRLGTEPQIGTSIAAGAEFRL